MNIFLPHGNVLTLIYALLLGTLQDYLTWILLLIFQTVLLLLLLLVWPVPFVQVLPRPQLILSSQNLVFWNLFEFSVTKII